MARKTKTPKWLSIFRRLYAYIGISGLSTALIGNLGISEHDMLLIMIFYTIGGHAIQIVCDAYGYAPERTSDFKPEKPEIKE